MKCANCQKEWIVVQGFRYPEKCPFCGLNIYGNNIGSGVLGWVVNEYGYDVLKHRRRLIAFIRDLYRDEIIQKRLIVAVNAGVANYYYEASKLMGLSRKNQITQAMKLLKDTLGFGDNVVQSILKEFDASIGIHDEVVSMEYHDADDTYYNLALKATRKSFWPLLLVSVEAGNKKAIKKYLSLIKDNWDKHLSEEDWYKYNRMIASLEDKESRDAYMIVLMKKLYEKDLDVDDEFDCIDELFELCPYSDDAVFEMTIRGFVFGCHSEYSVKESIINIYSLADKDYVPAVEIKDVLEDEFDIKKGFYSIIGIENVLDVYRPDEDYSYNSDKCNRLLSIISYIAGSYYGDNTNRRIFWYEKCIDYARETERIIDFYDYRTIEFEIGQLFIENENYRNVEKGIKYLEDVNTNDSALYLSELYLKDQYIKRNLKKSFEYLYDFRFVEEFHELYYEIGWRYFYGLGCKINIKRAIQYFEGYLDWMVCDPNEEETFIYYYKTIPFLIELYYEDLLIYNSGESLDKLKNYAEFLGNKMAQRYLWRYYSDKDNLYQDSIEAKKYKRLYKCGKRMIYESTQISMAKVNLKIDLINGQLGMISYGLGLLNRQINNTSNSFMDDSEDYVDGLISYRDHLLLENDEHKNDGDTDDSLTNSYYVVAELIYHLHPNNPIFLVRVRNYLDNYLSLSIEKESDKYISALKLWLNVWALQIARGQGFNYHKALYNLEYLKDRDEHVDVNIEQSMYLRLFMHFYDQKDYKNAVKYLECACELNLDYKCDLGVLKFVELNEFDEGYKLINDSYNKYVNGLEVNISDIGMAEYLIGFYRLMHKDDYTYSETISLWKSAIEHCDEDGSNYLTIIGECMKDGKFYDSGFDVTITVIPDYSMAFDAFCKGAIYNNRDCIYNMAEMLEKGRGFPSDIYAAKDFYMVALNKGIMKAEKRINDIDNYINSMAETIELEEQWI